MTVNARRKKKKTKRIQRPADRRSSLLSQRALASSCVFFLPCVAGIGARFHRHSKSIESYLLLARAQAAEKRPLHEEKSDRRNSRESSADLRKKAAPVSRVAPRDILRAIVVASRRKGLRTTTPFSPEISAALASQRGNPHYTWNMVEVPERDPRCASRGD